MQGISLFTVPRKLLDENGQPSERNDVVLAGINHKMGYRGTVNCVLNFGEGRFTPEGEAGAIGELVGEAGKGLAYMFHMMNEARISVGLGAAALGYTGYLHALDYAKLEYKVVLVVNAIQVLHKFRLFNMRMFAVCSGAKAYVSGALALCLYAARLTDDIHSLEDAEQRDQAHQLLDLLTPVVKSWSSEWGLWQMI